MVGLFWPEHGGYEDLHAQLVGLWPLLWLDYFADYGDGGRLTGRGRPIVGSPDVAAPDGARDFKHGVDVLSVVGAAGLDEVESQEVV